MYVWNLMCGIDNVEGNYFWPEVDFCMWKEILVIIGNWNSLKLKNKLETLWYTSNECVKLCDVGGKNGISHSRVVI